MKARMWPWMVAGSALLLASSVAMAAGGAIGGTSRRSNRRDRDRKPSRYYVLLIRDADGSVATEVVGNIKYADRRKEIEKEFYEAAMEWKKAQREAKRAKEPFDEKPPQGPKLLKRLSKSFKEKDAAEEYAEKYQEYIEKKMEKARAKKEGGGEDFLDDGGEKKDKGGEKKDKGGEKKKGEKDRA